MRYQVLGAVAVLSDDGTWREAPTAKQRTLLASLLIRANEWVTAARLVELVWAGQPPRSAYGNLKTYVWRLRTLLAAAGHDGDQLESRPGGYRLRVEPGELDLHAFDALTTSGRRALTGGDPAGAVRLFAAALTLWPAQPAGDASTALSEVDAVRLRELLGNAQAGMVEAQLAEGRPDGTIPLLRALVADQPLGEHWWALLIRALAQAGRRAEAVAAYQRVCRLLDRELGLRPGSGLRAAYDLVLTG